MLAIIDYGAGNTYNVEKTFAYLGVQATLTADPAKILASDGLILPGVGAFNAAMTNLKQRGLVEPIKEAVKKGTPFLGICLGMQMLFDYSTEYGQTAGLGFIPGQVVELPKQPGLLVPEVGWNQNRLVNPASAYRQVDGEFTYFVHSYYA
ncbi:imidazole glycerol phosphate synthase, glutamine amidotransferase subunit [Limosilactobacillus fermentum ATCC 14931]|nr:imidazole glycerol phosphate synthase, glutamine amidotransferase subunit [Limosilactobacillus fermentum ATCC 14931]